MNEAVRRSGIDADHSLYGLAEKLPSYLLDARSGSTVKKHSYGMAKWKRFAEENRLEFMPASPIHISLFVVYLLVWNHLVWFAI